MEAAGVQGKARARNVDWEVQYIRYDSSLETQNATRVAKYVESDKAPGD